MKRSLLLKAIKVTAVVVSLWSIAVPSALAANYLLSIRVDTTTQPDTIERVTGIEIEVNRNDWGYFSDSPPWYVYEYLGGLNGFLGADWKRNSYADGKLTYTGTDSLGGDEIRLLDGLVYSEAAGPPLVTDVRLHGFDGTVSYGLTSPSRWVSDDGIVYDYYELYIILMKDGLESHRPPEWGWPAYTPDWATSTPEAQYMDSAKLNAMLGFIEQQIPKDNSDPQKSQQIATHSAIVIRRGKIVFEAYPNPDYTVDTPHVANSVTKSFLSALVGIAIDKGLLSGTDQNMVDLFPGRTIQNLTAQKQRVTLDHILKMQPGLEWDEWAEPYTGCNNDYINALWCQGDPVQYILNLPMTEEPGTRWNYNGGTSHLLSVLIAGFSGTNDTLAFARQYLLNPLGATYSSWEKAADGIPQGGGGLWLKPRDMARFGYLYLHKGLWNPEQINGQQIISGDFVSAATATHSYLYTTQFGVRGYGYQSWWTYPAHGVYYADGLNGQKIYVIPHLDLVVVFTAHLTSDPGYWQDRMVFEYIIPAAGPIPEFGLADVILALKCLVGMDTASAVSSDSDVSGDEKIGLAEVIHMLEALAGTRG